MPDAATLAGWFSELRYAWYAAPLVAATFIVLGAMFVPVMLLITATGIAFGPWLGPIYAMVGSLASGSAGFGLGRWAGPRRVERWIHRRVPRLTRALERHGTIAVFFIRKIPLPFTLVNIAIGATRVRYRDFLLGTALGMTAAVVALAGFGGTLFDLVRHPTPRSIAIAAVILGFPLIVATAINVTLGRRARSHRMKLPAEAGRR